MWWANSLPQRARVDSTSASLRIRRNTGWWYGAATAIDSDVRQRTPETNLLYGPAEPMELPPADGAATDPAMEPNADHMEQWMPPDRKFLDGWMAASTELVDLYHPECGVCDGVWLAAAWRIEPACSVQRQSVPCGARVLGCAVGIGRFSSLAADRRWPASSASGECSCGPAVCRRVRGEAAHIVSIPIGVTSGCTRGAAQNSRRGKGFGAVHVCVPLSGMLSFMVETPCGALHLAPTVRLIHRS
jgi:hypothetical protein